MNQPDLPRRPQRGLPGTANYQDLHLEPVRHYTDLVCIMIETYWGRSTSTSSCGGGPLLLLLVLERIKGPVQTLLRQQLVVGAALA